MTTLDCPCVPCELDRKAGRPQYLLYWSDLAWKKATKRYYRSVITLANRDDDVVVERSAATRFGPNHAADAPALVPELAE